MLSITDGSRDSAGSPVGTWGRWGCRMPRESAFVCEAQEPVLQPPPLPQNTERGKPKRKGAGSKAGAGCFRRASPLTLKSLFAFHFGIFLPLHSAVLEPDLDLSLVETQVVGDLYAPSASEVAVKVEFFFQFQSLVARVTGSGPLAVRLWNINPPSQDGVNSVQRPSIPTPAPGPHSGQWGEEASRARQARRAASGPGPAQPSPGRGAYAQAGNFPPQPSLSSRRG